MDRELRENRHYTTTDLSTLKEGGDPDERREVLFKLYDQACTTWRELVGVRFKLLGAVPTVSLLAVASILSNEGIGKGFSQGTKAGIAVFGFVVTLGLLIYDLRNSELHDDLISRGRKIEEELGVNTGIFLGRLKSRSIIKHDIATRLIYGSSLLAWLIAIFAMVRCACGS